MIINICYRSVFEKKYVTFQLGVDLKHRERRIIALMITIGLPLKIRDVYSDFVIAEFQEEGEQNILYMSYELIRLVGEDLVNVKSENESLYSILRKINCPLPLVQNDDKSNEVLIGVIGDKCPCCHKDLIENENNQSNDKTSWSKVFTHMKARISDILKRTG